MNTFDYSCEECEFHTDILSNWKVHVKSKKHAKLHLGIKINFCECCNKQFKQKSIYDRHLLSKAHLLKSNVSCKETKKESIANILKITIDNYNDLEKEHNNISKKINDWNNNNLIFMTVLNSGKFTRYKKPKVLRDLHEELENIDDKQMNMDILIDKWKYHINNLLGNKYFSQLISNWRQNM